MFDMDDMYDDMYGDVCYEPTVVRKPSSFCTNTDKNSYDALTILVEVLEQRTGDQGWFWVSDDASDSRGRPMKGYVALHCGNTRARNLREGIIDTHDFSAVWYAESLLLNGPKFDKCRVLDSRDQRALLALYWTRKAERYERWTRDRGGSFWQNDAKEARKKAQEALGVTEQVSCRCGHVHNHPGKTPISLPTPEDIRKMIEKIVDANLVKFLLAQEKKGV